MVEQKSYSRKTGAWGEFVRLGAVQHLAGVARYYRGGGKVLGERKGYFASKKSIELKDHRS